MGAPGTGAGGAGRTDDEAGEKDVAIAAGRDAARKLDKAASKGVIHKNQAAIRKSAIAKTASSL